MKENCRTCLNYLITEDCVSVDLNIFENKSVLDLIQHWASIEVVKADKLPTVICKNCYGTIKTFTDFIVLIRKCDNELKQKLLKRDYDGIWINHQTMKDSDKLEIVEKTKEGIQDMIMEKSQSESKQVKNINESDKSSEKLNVKSNFSFKKSNKEKLKKPLTKTKKNATVLYECLKCQKTFKRSYHYKMHMTVHTGERKYICTICGKYFSRSYVLIYHMRVHTGEKKFSCNVCSKSFIHPSNLYKHKKIHTGTRNYKCDQCNKSFIQSEALKIHIRRIHTGEKPFLCEICSKSFSSQSALWIHKQDTHEEKEVCTICKKEFSIRILKRHIERHKNKEENIKKCICEQCGKNFSSDHNLRKHLLSHKGMKPYASQPTPCPLCKKLYSKRRIKSHICIPMKN